MFLPLRQAWEATIGPAKQFMLKAAEMFSGTRLMVGAKLAVRRQALEPVVKVAEQILLDKAMLVAMEIKPIVH